VILPNEEAESNSPMRLMKDRGERQSSSLNYGYGFGTKLICKLNQGSVIVELNYRLSSTEEFRQWV